MRLWTCLIKIQYLSIYPPRGTLATLEVVLQSLLNDVAIDYSFSFIPIITVSIILVLIPDSIVLIAPRLRGQLRAIGAD